MNVRYRKNDGRMVDHYPASFSLDDLVALGEFLEEYPTCPLREVHAGSTDPAFVVLRHDVDHNLEHALRFARWEANLGVRGSYYVLPEAWYWAGGPAGETQDVPRLVDELEGLGHEVGLHQNVCSAAFREGYRRDSGASRGFVEFYERAAMILEQQLAELRSYGVDVVGTAAHGDRLYYDEGIDNASLFAVWPPENFELTYEAYGLHVESGCRYVSDNRGSFAEPYRPVDPLRQTHLVLHPCHWTVPK